MLLFTTKKPILPTLTARRRATSSVIALLRQDIAMSIKRDKWTEDDLNILPQGEHDFFERKSGLLFNDTGELLGKLAKTLSAFANSGGGHILLGVDDGGLLDGVPTLQGRISTRDWLEQKIPHLLSYPLSDFRVHVVERSIPSQIPSDREVIVIDVGDSALAPHQCMHGGGDARKYAYYYRQAGRSEPAPHFYLELLRQRLVSPVLEVSLKEIVLEDVYIVDDAIFLETRIRFNISNIGRVTAYKWALLLKTIDNIPKDRENDYRVGVVEYPVRKSRNRGVRMDDTLLPGCSLSEYKDIGIFLRSMPPTAEDLKSEIERMIRMPRLGCQLATETSPGDIIELDMAGVVDTENIVHFITSRISHNETESKVAG